MHNYWWNYNGWARCECGEYLCVVGRKIEPTARAVADSALDTHCMTGSAVQDHNEQE